MGELTPVAFDIETSGLDSEAVVTVVGFAHDLRNWLVLNTAGLDADPTALTDALANETTTPTTVAVVGSERALLEAVYEFVADSIDGDSHYLTACNGETWNGGFDLPFLRSACHRNDVKWPFGDIAYADTMDAIQRFDTGDTQDLAGVYDHLIGDDHCDPFEDSESAVAAFEAGDWLALLKHNLADIERTRELTALASRFVPQSDFQMKNLAPPQR